MKSARLMTATLLCLSCTCAFAQNYPSRPARMVVLETAKLAYYLAGGRFTGRLRPEFVLLNFHRGLPAFKPHPAASGHQGKAWHW